MGAAVPSKAELRTDCCGLRVARRRGGPMRKLSVTLRDGERNCEAVQYALTVQHQRSRNPPCRRRLEHCGAARRDGVNRPAIRNITEAHRQVVHLSPDPRWRFPSAFPTAPRFKSHAAQGAEEARTSLAVQGRAAGHHPLCAPADRPASAEDAGRVERKHGQAADQDQQT